jgi:hypothetical protein
VSVVPHIENTLDELLDLNRFLDDKPLAIARGLRRRGVVAYNTHVDIVPQVLAAMQALPLNEGGNLPFYDPLEGHMNNEPVTEWHIVPGIIHMYNQNTRADKVGLTFRTINNDVLEGKAEMLSCFQPRVDGALRPTCCETIPESAAKLGAIYQFRSNDPDDWFPSQGNYLLSGDNCVGRENRRR